MEIQEKSAQASNLNTDAAIQTPHHYGAIGRVEYFCGLVVFTFAFSMRETPSGALLTVLAGILSLILVYYRLKNIGMNPWWFVLILVPIVNLFVGLACLALQEGFVETKKLDSTGKVIAKLVTYISTGILMLVFVGVLIEKLISS